MGLISLVIAIIVCFFVWLLFSVYKLYLKIVLLRRKSAVLLMRKIEMQAKFLRILRITNTSIKGFLIFREIIKVIETVKTVSFLVCLVFKKR